MTVKQLADAAGLAPHTLRYYVRLGLLRPARDPVNGYKLFTERDLLRLWVVRQAQGLGLTLGEIRELLGACEAGGAVEEAMLAVSRRRLRETEEALRSLQAVHRRLGRALRLWEHGQGRAASGLEGLAALLEEVAEGAGSDPAPPAGA